MTDLSASSRVEHFVEWEDLPIVPKKRIKSVIYC